MESNIDEKVNTVHHEKAPSINDLNKSTTVDTIHNDEAVRVLAQYAGDEAWTEQEEKKLRMKIDRKLLSILCITYGLQYYDKAMLAQAARYILCFPTGGILLTNPGTIRPPNRSRPHNRKPLQRRLLYILHGFHLRRLSRHPNGPTLPHRTRSRDDHIYLGHNTNVHRRRSNLERPVRPALLPRFPRIRNLTHVHVGCWWLV